MKVDQKVGLIVFPRPHGVSQVLALSLLSLYAPLLREPIAPLHEIRPSLPVE